MKRRAYRSAARARGAEETRHAVLASALRLFSTRGLDRVTLTRVAARAGVGDSTVYALFGSKEGILRALMSEALFGPRYREATARQETITDPVARVLETASVARTIWVAESAELGLLRGASAFAPSLKRIEQEFERRRFELQRARVVALSKAGRLVPGLTVADARRILWALTNRETFTGLVETGGWSPAKYERWLRSAISRLLVSKSAASAR